MAYKDSICAGQICLCIICSHRLCQYVSGLVLMTHYDIYERIWPNMAYNDPVWPVMVKDDQ
jgi:hypothetical protein